MNTLPAPGTRVRLNVKANIRLQLGQNRARDPDKIGTVVEGVSASRTGPRPLIRWDGTNQTPEPVAIGYLEEFKE